MDPAPLPSEFDVFARFYDWDTDPETDDVDFYRHYADHAGSPILELGCGTGRVAIPLAAAGHRVTGLDISGAMLARAQRRAGAARLVEPVTWVRADMRAFELGREFNLGIVALNSFMHLMTPSDHLRALDCIRRHLVPDGLLILDLFNPDPAVLAEADGRLVHDFTRPGPGRGATTSRFHTQRVDPSRQLLEIVFFYDEVSARGALRRTVAPFTLYYFQRNELEMLLTASGLRLEHVYGDYELGDYWSASPKMIAVARRAA